MHVYDHNCEAGATNNATSSNDAVKCPNCAASMALRVLLRDQWADLAPSVRHGLTALGLSPDGVASSNATAPPQVSRSALEPTDFNAFDWPRMWDALLSFYIQNNHSNVPATFISKGNIPLGKQVRQIREGLVSLPDWRLELLEQVDFAWR